MADIAHPAGLVATGLHPSPMPFCDVVTTTTHKTLRGPRGGMIMMGKDSENPFGVVAPKSGRVKNMSELIDSMVMPGIQGGPLMHIIAAKAVAFGEALQPSFKVYTSQIVKNAQAMANDFLSKDYHLVSGGTDTHVILIDLTNKGITGKAAEKALEKAGITVNKNMVPFDERSPYITSGIRIGTPAITTRDMKKDQMSLICDLIDSVLQNPENDDVINSVRSSVQDLCDAFPRYRNVTEKDDRFIRGYGFQGGASRPNWRRGLNMQGIGLELKEKLRVPGSWQFNLGGFGEMLPDKRNRVLLDKNQQDQWGIPLLNIECELRDNELKMLDAMSDDAEAMLSTAGIINIQKYNEDAPPGLAIHEMGTARMGHNPSSSVLNKFNQTHDVSNLFVTDGSAMTSSACQNPSITYMALTARASAYAVQLLKAGTI